MGRRNQIINYPHVEAPSVPTFICDLLWWIRFVMVKRLIESSKVRWKDDFGAPRKRRKKLSTPLWFDEFICFPSGWWARSRWELSLSLSYPARVIVRGENDELDEGLMTCRRVIESENLCVFGEKSAISIAIKHSQLILIISSRSLAVLTIIFRSTTNSYDNLKPLAVIRLDYQSKHPPDVD